MSTLFARLKSATEQEHKDLEGIIDPMKNFSSLPAYKAHLVKTWILYQSLEAELAGLDWSAIGIDFDARRKTPLLEEDLRFLQVPFAGDAFPSLIHAPSRPGVRPRLPVRPGGCHPRRSIHQPPSGNAWDWSGERGTIFQRLWSQDG
jgi:hypothetical protein